MCIDSENGFKRASRSIPVWKVFMEREGLMVLPFRAFDGGNPTIDDILIKDRSIQLIIKYRSVGFWSGFGYHCFSSLIEAERYSLQLRDYFPIRIKEMRIPKGSNYGRGKIQSGYIGHGLNAIRTESLKLPRGEKICA